ncbi:hypothetical protein RhiirB3_158102 [Rhizophagus irregularis]|nr:hypothetical protein RhiirB3_158102 [Rhizophagus irregularis]
MRKIVNFYNKFKFYAPLPKFIQVKNIIYIYVIIIIIIKNPWKFYGILNFGNFVF